MSLDRANERIRGGEASAVNLISAIAPWLAPLAPAFMTFSHLQGAAFAFPFFVAFSVALTVEMLGFATISTLIGFWSYNKRRLAEYKKAPVGTVVFSFAMYLSVILLMNVALDAALVFNNPTASAWITVLAKALLTLLSVPAAILLATRTQHKEMLDTIKRDKEARKETIQRSEPQKQEAISHKKKRFLADYQSGRLQDAFAKTGANITAESIADAYRVSTRTAFRWLKSVKEGV